MGYLYLYFTFYGRPITISKLLLVGLRYRSQCSNYAKDWTIRLSSFSSPNRPDSRNQPVICPKGKKSYSARDKVHGAETDHSPSPSFEENTSRNTPPLFLYASMACTGTTLTLLFIVQRRTDSCTNSALDLCCRRKDLGQDACCPDCGLSWFSSVA
jgi:hypothetical protein